MTEQKYLLYVAYGSDELFYQGIIISLLSAIYVCPKQHMPIVVVISQRPELFNDYPVVNIPLTENMFNEWSLNGQYHYRIKNRALAYALSYLNIGEQDKILMLDADAYFVKSFLSLYEKIDNNHTVMFLNEGPITGKHYQEYLEHYYGKSLTLANGEHYQLELQARMWGSLMIGINGGHGYLIEQADQLMKAFEAIAPVRTIEQFALAESLEKETTIVEGKRYIKHYSHRGGKAYARLKIQQFLALHQHKPLAQQLNHYRQLNLKRDFISFLKQKLAIRSSI